VNPTETTSGYTINICRHCGDYYTDTITYLVVFKHNFEEYGRETVLASTGKVSIIPKTPTKPDTA
jgi:hypothetical protein